MLKYDLSLFLYILIELKLRLRSIQLGFHAFKVQNLTQIHPILLVTL